MNKILYKIYYLDGNGKKNYLTRTNQLPFWVNKASVVRKVSRNPNWFVETYELVLQDTATGEQFKEENK